MNVLSPQLTSAELVFAIVFQLSAMVATANRKQAEHSNHRPSAYNWQLESQPLGTTVENGVSIKFFYHHNGGRIYSWAECAIDVSQYPEYLIIQRDGTGSYPTGEDPKYTYQLNRLPEQLTHSVDTFSIVVAKMMFKHLAWTFKERMVAYDDWSVN